jgi:hypothetical protein
MPSRDSGDLNATRRELNDDQERGNRSQTAPGPDIDREEVRRGKNPPVDSQELGSTLMPGVCTSRHATPIAVRATSLGAAITFVLSRSIVVPSVCG